MALKIRLTVRAYDDLAGIRDYLLERSPQGADRVRAHVTATLDQLADLPLLGRATDEPYVRVVQLTRYPYRIFYSVNDDELIVLHVRHAARREIDPASL